VTPVVVVLAVVYGAIAFVMLAALAHDLMMWSRRHR
jgi:hypothetical protein